jgi:predicted P-loop ATPase
MVMRCLYPGAHFRIVTVLEGDQDIGKTWLVKKLAFHPSRYVAIDFGTDNIVERRRAVKGMTAIEFAELGAIDKVNQALLKRFISEEVDRTRTLFTEDFDATWRRGIIVGTYNPAKGGEVGYMSDMSGDTRFARVRSKSKGLIDHTLFDAVLQQLWAEAVYLVEKENVRGWLSDADKVLQEKMNAPGRRKSYGYDFAQEFIEAQASFGDHGKLPADLSRLKKQMIEDGITVEDIIGWARDSGRIPRDRTNVGFHSQVIQAIREFGFVTIRKANHLGRLTKHTFIYPADARDMLAEIREDDDS